MVAQSPDPLFERVGYDLDLERQAFGRLASLDAEGCQRALLALVGGIGVATTTDLHETIQLLAELLHRVNREVASARDEALCQARRLAVIRRFDRCGSWPEASERFRAALALVLASPSPVTSPADPAHRAKAWIERHYASRLSLSSVAEQLNVSPSHLARTFRREFGLTLTAHIQRVRVEQARRLLAQGGRRISEVAYMVGYQNYRDFYRNFVRCEKASPRAVQRRLAGGSRVS